MAMSYAFEGNCDKTIEYEQQVFDFYGSVKNFFQQGEIGDEAARVCLDSGDLNTASKWYEIGRDTGLKEPDITLLGKTCGAFGGSTRRPASRLGEATKQKRKGMLLRLRRSSTKALSPSKPSSSRT